MRTVGTRELKDRLSHYLRLVRAGGRLLVTDRGRPVAEIRAIPRSRRQDEIERRWREAAEEGLVTLPRGKGFRRIRPLRLPGGVTLSDAVLEDRR